MTPLALTLTQSPFEMPTSFASRLARRNMCKSLYQFAGDVDLHIRGVEIGEQTAIQYLCEIASLPADAFSKTLASGHTTTSIHVGPELYRSQTFARSEIRYCPVCIKEDTDNDRTAADAIHRLHWQIRSIAACHVHNVLLVTIPQTKSASRNLDTSLVFAEHLEHQTAVDKLKSLQATELEVYLSQRAYAEHQSCWADRMDVFSLVKACTALGLFIVDGSEATTGKLDTLVARKCANVGFQIIKGGPKPMRECWENFRKSRAYLDSKERYQPHPRFGAFQKLLGSDLKYRSEFAPIRRVFRDYLLSNFPFSSGTVVLGQRLPKRKLHSLRTAQRVVGKRLNIFHEKLETEGFAERDGTGRLKLIKPLSVPNVQQFADEINALLYEREAAVHVGITVESFRILVDADIIPASRTSKKFIRKGFHKDDLDVWCNKLFDALPHVKTVGRDQALFTKAPLRLNYKLADLLSALMTKKLAPKGLWHGMKRLDHIIIDLAAARTALPNLAPANGIQQIPTFRLLRLNNTTLRHLVDKGFLTRFWARHPDSQRMTAFICTKSIRKFNGEYVSLGALANHSGLPGGPQLIRLREARMFPAISGIGLSNIYRRADLSPNCKEVGLDLLL